MTSFKVPNKTLTILRENCLKLLYTNGSRVSYWRLPTYFQWKAFLLQNLKAMKVSKLAVTKLHKVLNFWWLFSLWWFTQFGLLLSPVALKVVGPLLLDSNSSRDDTNAPFQFPIWQLTNKETKRQAITKDQKMKWKLNQWSFNKTIFQVLFNNWSNENDIEAS